MNKNKFRIFRQRKNRFKLHEKRIDAKQYIHSFEKLVVFKSNRFQKI